MNSIGSALGNYETKGAIESADCIIGHSFGTLTDATSANAEIARYLLGFDTLPTIVDRTLANAFPASPEGIEQLVEIVEGQTSNAVGRGVGAWGTLLKAKEYMNKNDLHKPIMIAHACMIGRVVAQAQHKNIDIKSIVPADLPKPFDAKSKQPWTRSLALWVPREVVGSVVLRLQGKM